MSKTLIICHDKVDTRMAGPGIRYWEMARALAGQLGVTLAAPGGNLPDEGFATHIYSKDNWNSIAPLVAEADVLVLTGDLLEIYPQLTTCGQPLVIEATYPYTFEALQFHSSLPRDQQMTSFATRLQIMQRAALAGDFFFCATQRQRDYWLGVLDACGRINPDTYAADPTLHQLIDIVPFGLPSRPITQTAPAIKGVIPGIGPDDRVVLWGGGLWEWLDPLTLVRAIARVVEQRPDVRLVFPATQHPNPDMPDMPMHKKTVDLSDQLGLTNKVIFFGSWVPYEQWPNYLVEADIGLSLHFDALETHFAFRTRILDYIWAGLPMVVTGGDATSELVSQYNLGEVVPPKDSESVATAIGRLLDTPMLRDTYQKRFEQVRPHFTWERICQPIKRFCAQPRPAPDRASGALAPDSPSIPATQQEAELTRLRNLVASYERGRCVRLMRWLKGLQARIGGNK
jgi:glycosyltransferase involved in cell wall biosynthesis